MLSEADFMAETLAANVTWEGFFGEARFSIDGLSAR